MSANNAIDSGILDEAYERFHTTGPEFDDSLSNHGPMAVEAMVRHGHDREVHAWIDWYQQRLEDVPRGLTPVTHETWQEALGDQARVGDWTAFMLREVQLRPWRELLAEWWPRLLPGIIAGTTHGVIRVGHSVRALLAEEALGEQALQGPRIEEFAHALGYWAAKWKPLEVATPPHSGGIDAAGALAKVPSVAEQKISVTHRLSQLSYTPGLSTALEALRAPETPQQAACLLADVTDAAVHDYLTHGHANPIMLVHASTAPTAVLRTLPALPTELWIPSLDAAWLATAAVTAAYRNTEAPAEEVSAAVAQTGEAQESFDRAVRHKDEHAVKFADAALDVFERTGSRYALAAVTRATLMIKQG
ncbi:questin oxidase family protein [Actinospica sp.]|jgi:hypothetical protein|uniref:questin oxidase family protein n=1 Tax=Actinospica sp. TaxID=1872142 RepID=UPI002B962DF8|nr:questin oxidase family protein [Actinospica sp.]HWG28224.1 questin oxidase family protein [Actinospica sp.]